ncbi:hypothetical protein Dimus_038173 [Dionaea muscipula]
MECLIKLNIDWNPLNIAKLSNHSISVPPLDQMEANQRNTCMPPIMSTKTILGKMRQDHRTIGLPHYLVRHLTIERLSILKDYMGENLSNVKGCHLTICKWSNPYSYIMTSYGCYVRKPIP